MSDLVKRYRVIKLCENCGLEEVQAARGDGSDVLVHARNYDQLADALDRSDVEQEQVENEPLDWEAFARELAKRLSEASKDSKAMDELAKEAFVRDESTQRAFDFKNCVFENEHPFAYAQIARRKDNGH